MQVQFTSKARYTVRMLPVLADVEARENPRARSSVGMVSGV